MEKIKATFTIDKELWKKFRLKVTAADKKYSRVLEELVKGYLR